MSQESLLSHSGDITSRKALTYIELRAAGIRAIPHTLLNPEHPLSSLHEAVKGGLALPFVLKDDAGAMKCRSCTCTRHL